MMNSQNHSALPSPATATPVPTTVTMYPTVSPQTVIIPIVSSIVVFPAAALTVICCLRYRARRARRRAKQPRLSEKSDRTVPIIRIDGTRRPDLGPKGKWKRRDDSKHMNELHFTSATVFQAVLGIDLDLDERSEWENEVMGYTTVRGASPTSSTASVQAGQPRIIEMEMSPRVPRSPRASPAPDEPAQPGADAWRQRGPPSGQSPPQSNGRPPGLAPEPQEPPPAGGPAPEPQKLPPAAGAAREPRELPPASDSPPEPGRRPSGGGPSAEPRWRQQEDSFGEEARLGAGPTPGEQLRFIDDGSEAS